MQKLLAKIVAKLFYLAVFIGGVMLLIALFVGVVTQIRQERERHTRQATELELERAWKMSAALGGPANFIEYEKARNHE